MSKLSPSQLVTIIGGSGFVGRQVVRELARTGARVRVAVRHPNEAMFLRTMGGIGQIQIVQANIRNEASLANAIDGADMVVNLVGTLTGKGKQTFNALHDAGAETVARLCAEMGIGRLVHMSALGADIRSTSAYGRSKAAGEAAVTEACPDATILRPSVIFGPEDGFFCRFGSLVKSFLVVPVMGGGQTRFQPVYVDDVADAIVAVLQDNSTAGKVFELGGPRVWTLREVLDYVVDVTHRTRLLVPMPLGLAKFASIFLQMPPLRLIYPDEVNMLRQDNVVSEEAAGLANLGITPTPAESIAPKFLRRYRRAGAYERD